MGFPDVPAHARIDVKAAPQGARVVTVRDQDGRDRHGALVSADPYGSLEVPLLDGRHAIDAAATLLNAARTNGARALLLRNLTLDGKVFDAFAKAGARDGIAPLILQSHARACLDATQDAERLLRDALGAKKLKELRRQRNRLAEHGAVAFEVASSPSDVSRALESFLALEASGW